MDYESMSVADLKELAKEKGIKGITALKKADIINLIKNAEGENKASATEEKTSNKASKADKSSGEVKASKADKSSGETKASKADKASEEAKASKADKASEAGKADKASEASKADKASEASKSDKASGEAKAGKADKSSGEAKSGKADKAGNTRKAAETGKTEETDKSEKADKAENTDKSEKADKVEKADKADKVSKSDKVVKHEKVSEAPRQMPERPVENQHRILGKYAEKLQRTISERTAGQPAEPRRMLERAGEQPAENQRRILGKYSEKLQRQMPEKPLEQPAEPRRMLERPVEQPAEPRRMLEKPANQAQYQQQSQTQQSHQQALFHQVQYQQPQQPQQSQQIQQSQQAQQPQQSQQAQQPQPQQPQAQQIPSQQPQTQQPRQAQPENNAPFDPRSQAGTELDSGVEKNGILEIMPDGFGFIRCDNFLPGNNDVYVSPMQIKRYGLRSGDIIRGNTKVQAANEKFSALLYIKDVNGYSLEDTVKRKKFETLTPIFPKDRIHTETPSSSVAMRMVDLIAPIGKGQRGMIVSQPKSGKTTLLKEIANSITRNHPDMHLIILLIDERPEEVTDMKESIKGEKVEVIYSTFDELPENHKRVSEMVIERAKRLVEHGEDVVILLDSITRLARAYNLTVTSSGRTLSGGLDPAALHMPKKFFGAARTMREGGSLTILATALVDTGSRMDDVVFEEFKGTGNMELVLDRNLSERRIFPAIDLAKSGTRRDDLLLTKEEYDAMAKVRRALNGAHAEEATERLINMCAHTRNNAEFVQTILKGFNA